MARTEALSIAEWHASIVRERLLDQRTAASVPPSGNTARELLLSREANSKAASASVEFLLHVLAALARTHISAFSGNTAQIALKEVFELSYGVVELRDLLYKPGRDVLSALCSIKPQFISYLIKWVAFQIAHIGASALYLFQELPLASFRPTSRDLAVLDTWLSSPLDSVPNRLAQLVISGLKWGDLQMISPASNRAITLLVAAAHSKRGQDTRARSSSSIFSSVKVNPSEVKLAAFSMETVLKSQHFGGDTSPLMLPVAAASAYVSGDATTISALGTHWKQVIDKLPAEKNLTDPATLLDPVLVFALVECTDIGGFTSPSIFQRITLPLLKLLLKSKAAALCLRILHDIMPSVIHANFNSPEGDRLASPAGSQTISFVKDILLVRSTIRTRLFDLVSLLS